MAAQEETMFSFENKFATIDLINGNYILRLADDSDENNILLASLYESEIPFKKMEGESEHIYTINVEHIQSLKQMIMSKLGVLSYNDVLNMVIHIGKQCTSFVKNGYAIPYINMNNIVVLNSNTFLLIDADILRINSDESINIDVPYDKTHMLGYELNKVITIPAQIHNSNWVYSIALIAIHCLTGLDTSKITNYDDSIESIQDTKLYFMLLRCLNKYPKERRFLYI